MLTRATAAVAGLVLVMAAGSTAYAKNWKTYDTDSLNRTVPSQKAYSTGSSMVWQNEKIRGQVPDVRVKFAVNLHVDGARNSCAWLRVITYQNNGFKRTQSKRFPASASKNFGYYRFCQASGKGVKSYTGSDELNNHVINNNNNIDLAKVSICYTASKSRAPSGDCYAFTVKKGDY
ncbi:hypothetical protein [Aeromicrobium sp. CnD17-E]|uniref:hypothetical protein n=1 Tax=Aeromicrobium sp. CnD17-E TaxID=2954487 RepID=UPI00209763E4|nr:hypothetical protein [Aeromicrobium sp. CnD17-E]MCO7237810.1 hypothetical protein [Aeromicrobium sp. CnD17-E]